MSNPNRPDDDLIPEADDAESLYSPEYLRECADPEARSERLAELKRRIAQRAYRVDPDRIAEEMLIRGDLGES